jgi:hypothetical protein
MTLPYGVWFLTDGAEVMFSREYCPLWKRHPSGEVKRMGYERVPYVRQAYFHIGGIVSHQLFKLLVQAEVDFVDGFAVEVLVARINDRFPGMWSVMKKRKAAAKIDGANVVRLFPRKSKRP